MPVAAEPNPGREPPAPGAPRWRRRGVAAAVTGPFVGGGPADGGAAAGGHPASLSTITRELSQSRTNDPAGPRLPAWPASVSERFHRTHRPDYEVAEDSGGGLDGRGAAPVRKRFRNRPGRTTAVAGAIGRAGKGA